MKRRKGITLLMLCFLTVYFSSCDFAIKDKDGNKIKFDFVEENNLLQDEKLDMLLGEYSTTLHAVRMEDIEEGQMTERQKQNIITDLTKTRRIATRITRYIKSYGANMKKSSKGCPGEIEKLKQADAALDIVIDNFSTYDTQNPHMMKEPFLILGTKNFADYIMHVYNTRLGCTVSIDTIQ